MTETATIDRQQESEAFDAPVRAAPDIDALILNLDGYAGPLDVLLDLARTQRVDIRKISMIRLVDQYLDFIAAARARSLELAADYLVMASWLTYLKSKLLIPAPAGDGGEPTADEMAARLAFQLQRLEAMRKSAESLLGLPQFGVDFFARGAPEGVRVLKSPLWQAELFELLQAYARQRVAAVDRTYKPEPPRVWTIEDARARIARLLGSIPEWTPLAALAPLREIDAPAASVAASAFNAALEFAKNGAMEIRQTAHFEPIYVRRRERANEDKGARDGAE
ncbi:MAG TPA: segregation/condensation protein A [Parvularcula sp.]|nr:segregation/condensation protein A [Parvularcula sp.]